MCLVNVRVNAPYDLFHTWSKEIHDLALKICGEKQLVYLVFTDGDNDHVYFPLLDWNMGELAFAPSTKSVGVDSSFVQRDQSFFDDSIHMTPVHCFPQVDMSVTSFEMLTGLHDAPYSHDAIEDISIGDVINYGHFLCPESCPRGERAETGSALETDLVVCPPAYGKDVKSMCMFYNMAVPGADTGPLCSYINQIISERSYGDLLFRDHEPLKHTRLELESEMMKCNRSMYAVYKYNKTLLMLESIVEKSRSKSEMEHGISGLVYEILCETVVSCMGSTWCFVDGMWEEASSDGYIWNFLTTEFIEYLANSGADKIALHIMSVTIRSRILKDIKFRLQNDHFENLLDSKSNLLRMTNGVYDTNTMILSEPVPSDYVSVKAGVPYQVFDEDSKKMAQLMYILGTIFPNPELLDFFILSCSTFLEGYNSPKVFFIWWGEGNNAKSLVQTLVMKTFGQYCSTAPTSLVTGKRTESSNATPELCHIEKRRVVFLQEPNPEERIKAGKIKEMTGNDSMYVRQLFKSGKTMTLKAKIVIVCNNIMEIPGMDAAIRRRIVVVPFISTFLDAAEYRSREMKGTLEPCSNIIDLKVEKDLLDCKSAFMYLLCKRYDEWAHRSNMSLDIPDIVKEVTEDYITRNNYPLKFITSYVHRIDGSGEGVAISEIYEMYKDWFKRSYPSRRTEDFERFAKEMSDGGYRDDGRGIVYNIFVSYNGELTS